MGEGDEIQTDSRRWTDGVLACSLLSLFSALAVVYLIHAEQKYKKALYLQLLNRLLWCNIGINLSSLFYTWILSSKDALDQNRACAAYLPFASFFLVASYGYTFMMAVRFKGSHNLEGFKNFKSVPLYAPLSLSLVLIFPMIIANIAAFPGATWFDGDGGDISSLCTYDRRSVIGSVMSLVLLDFPIFILILLNFKYYIRGIKALEEKSPYSVVSRRQSVAFGYLFVQLIVFIPNVVFNIWSIYDSCNDCHGGLYGFTIVANVLQGFLNVLVYVYADTKIYDFFYRVFCKAFSRKEQSPTVIGGGVWAGPPPPPTARNEEENDNDSEADFIDSWFDTLFPCCKSTEGNNLNDPLVKKSDMSDEYNNTTAKGKSNTLSVDLDTEKYVHFGDIETNMLSFVSSYRSTSTDQSSSDAHAIGGGNPVPRTNLVPKGGHLSTLSEVIEKPIDYSHSRNQNTNSRANDDGDDDRSHEKSNGTHGTDDDDTPAPSKSRTSLSAQKLRKNAKDSRNTNDAASAPASTTGTIS